MLFRSVKKWLDAGGDPDAVDPVMKVTPRLFASNLLNQSIQVFNMTPAIHQTSGLGDLIAKLREIEELFKK